MNLAALYLFGLLALPIIHGFSDFIRLHNVHVLQHPFQLLVVHEAAGFEVRAAPGIVVHRLAKLHAYVHLCISTLFLKLIQVLKEVC